MSGAPRRRPRHRLAMGGRPRNVFDDLELIVARVIGRDLRLWEGLLFRIASVALFAWLLIVIGIPVGLWFGEWWGTQVAHQVQHTLGTPLPSR